MRISRWRTWLSMQLSFLHTPRERRKITHTRVNGYELLVMANEDVGRSIVFRKSFEPGETAFIRRFLSPESVCLDVGANIGYYTLLMALSAPLGRVYAFEPIQLNSALLRASAKLNDASNIDIIECAIGSSEGIVQFSQSSDSAFSSLLPSSRKPSEREISVPLTTLDAFVQKASINKIDLLKVDVEGAEALVVRGASSLLSDSLRRPGLVLLELYQPNLDPFKADAMAIVCEMQSHGYSPFLVDPHGNRIPFDRSALTSHYNVFFST